MLMSHSNNTCIPVNKLIGLTKLQSVTLNTEGLVLIHSHASKLEIIVLFLELFL